MFDRPRFRRPRFQYTLALPLHPTIQQILLKPPPIPQFECRDSVLAQVLVQSVRRDSQILGRFAQCHYFLESFHFLPCLSQNAGCFIPRTPACQLIFCYSLACFGWESSLSSTGFLDNEANSVDIPRQEEFLRNGPELSRWQVRKARMCLSGPLGNLLWRQR